MRVKVSVSIVTEVNESKDNRPVSAVCLLFSRFGKHQVNRHKYLRFIHIVLLKLNSELHLGTVLLYVISSKKFYNNNS